MTDIERDQHLVRFANFLRSIPHRKYCNRTRDTSHRCSCDIGGAAHKVYEEFVNFMLIAAKNP